MKTMSSSTDSRLLSDQLKDEFEQGFKKLHYDVVTKEGQNFFHFIIHHCNGTGPWSFCDATIDYDEGKRSPVYVWFKSIYLDIANKLCIPNSICTTEEEQIFKCLNETKKKQPCLAKLLETKDNITEEKIKCLLALHYFKPLAVNSVCVVDSCYEYKRCELCNEIVKADHRMTSFGNSLVWHGQADIFVRRSVVKIQSEDVLIAKHLQEEDGVDEDGNSCSSIDNVKIVERKILSQAIAEAIVNAFCECRRDVSLFDKFIPSFLATERNIRIIMYNCQLDKLLVSTEFPIWEGKNLNIKTMMQVWLTLNYTENIDILETQESKFKESVGEAYEIYLNRMTRPTTIEYKDFVHEELEAAELKKIKNTDVELFEMFEKIGSEF